MADAIDTHNTPTHIVGIGASAGGLEAIEAFFGEMPKDSGLSFVVIQHLSPDYKSLMVELLSKRTPMPVHRAKEGMVVALNTVYLIPPKKNLTIYHGRLMLADPDFSTGINLPIDIFLRSLAEDQGDRAIGIILSGTGSDGMRGIRAIKEHGGMAMVQNEQSAKFDGMPRAALSTGLADIVTTPSNMPAQLIAFVQHPLETNKLKKQEMVTDEDGIQRLFSMIRDRCKIDFSSYKPATIHRRIERRMTINQIRDVREYVDYCAQYPGEVIALQREMLIGVTNFFRDPFAFEQLDALIFKHLFASPSSAMFRFWVAGCSTGEEAYSIAIKARESMEQLGVNHDIKIFATDVDKNAIISAGNGIYPESIAADVGSPLLAKYFHHKGDAFHISRNIREMVVFAEHNLIKDPPFTNLDLVSCRNLLIYLKPEAQRRAIEMFRFSLGHNGGLFLGTSETPGEISDSFEVLHQKAKIFRAKGGLHRSSGVNEMLDVSGERFKLFRRRYAGSRLTGHPGEEDRVLKRFVAGLAESILPLTLVVSETLELIHVVGDTEGFIKLPAGRMQTDVTKLVARELSILLSTAVQKVVREKKSVRYANIRCDVSGTVKTVTLRVLPLPSQKGQEDLVAVCLEAEDRPQKRDTEVSQNYDLSLETEQHIRDLDQELQFTKENLQATIEELETANEELQATNEELLASNEELQSTNEELQSTNEELHTVNTEYQAKIIELTELNNDVDNLLSHSQIGKLILDENMEIRRFSSAVTRIFHILQTDVGRPITHVTHNLVDCHPKAIILEVQKSKEITEATVHTEEGRGYLMRVLPYHIGPQSFSGTVLTFVDITALEKAQRDLVTSQARLEAATQLARLGYWEFDVATETTTWSKGVFDIYELDGDEVPPEVERPRFYSADDQKTISDHFQKAVTQGKGYDLTLPMTTARGNRRNVRTIVAAKQCDGRVVKLFGAIQDITGKMAAKEREAALKERFELAMQAGRDGVWEWDIPTGAVYYSRTWAEIVEETEVPPYYETWNARVHPDDRALVTKSLKDHLELRSEHWLQQHRLRTRNGQYKTVLGRGEVVTRDGEGKPLRMIGTMTDMTHTLNQTDSQEDSTKND